MEKFICPTCKCISDNVQIELDKENQEANKQVTMQSKKDLNKMKGYVPASLWPKMFDDSSCTLKLWGEYKIVCPVCREKHYFNMRED